jgi:hypothetical protein
MIEFSLVNKDARNCIKWSDRGRVNTINSSLTKQKNRYTMLEKGFKNFENFTRALKVGTNMPL